MRTDYANAYTATSEFHATMHVFFTKAIEEQKRLTDMHDAADNVYALRSMYRLLDDLRKSAHIAQELAERMACLLWTKDGGEQPNIKTAYCTGTPDVSMIASIPKRDKHPDEFYALMDHFGIPRTAFPGDDDDIVRPHWPGVVAALSKAIAEGKPLPKGIDPTKTYPKYSLTVRGKKGVDE